VKLGLSRGGGGEREIRGFVLNGGVVRGEGKNCMLRSYCAFAMLLR